MKFPFIQCFTGDWLKDPAVSMLSPAARGIWWDFICVMHESDRSGTITGSLPMLARLVRCSTEELSSALAEMKACRTADITECHGVVTVTNRRMKREADERNSNTLRKQEQRQRESVAPPVTDSSRLILHNSESQSSDKASKRLMPGEGGKLSPSAVEAVQLAESVLNGEWVNDAGKWVARSKTDAGKVFRVMADVRSAIVEGRVKTSPARMAEHNWKIFK